MLGHKRSRVEDDQEGCIISKTLCNLNANSKNDFLKQLHFEMSV